MDIFRAVDRWFWPWSSQIKLQRLKLVFVASLINTQV